jgi:hypothetical protein
MVKKNPIMFTLASVHNMDTESTSDSVLQHPGCFYIKKFFFFVCIGILAIGFVL